MTLEISVPGPNGARLTATIQTNLQAHSLLSDRPGATIRMQDEIAESMQRALLKPSEAGWHDDVSTGT